ncbi:MAG: NADH-quinone oxidoreductase subunit H [Victivallaceae bacterium]|nr:NADH-quinone oxidoreductase subunit H [Victivallaceae bacterium]
MTSASVVWWVGLAAGLVGAPLLPGLINRVKAFFAGRRGPSLFQLYFDMYKLLRKAPVYSSVTGWLSRAAPVLTLAATLATLLLLPLAGVPSPFAFSCDIILFLYLAGAGRFATVLGALDTGSSFEGMGASRECQFSMLAEGVMLAVFGALVLMAGQFSLGGCLNQVSSAVWSQQATALILLLASFYVVVLAETCRVPVDDPETHLELTMIHEAMILDNSGVDLAMIHYAAALKLWVMIEFGVMLLLPVMANGWITLTVQILCVFGWTASIGVAESIMARYRFLKVPHLLAGALCLGVMAVVVLLLFRGVARI